VLNLGLPKGFSRVAIALFRPGSQMANTLSNSIALCVLAAHLILELLARLRDVGLADELSYLLPLTQELIADVLGLSGPHVSRMLRSLREEGLVTIEGHRKTCWPSAISALVKTTFPEGSTAPRNGWGILVSLGREQDQNGETDRHCGDDGAPPPRRERPF
jgi:DNA-binding transcriptional ArsR family regulator